MSMQQMLLGTSSGPSVDLDVAFDIKLYTGTGGTEAIDNGLDYTATGGMVWIKQRNGQRSNLIADTEKGIFQYLSSNTTQQVQNNTNTVAGLNDDGFVVKNDVLTGENNRLYVAWSWINTDKFFDHFEYNGSGSTTSVSHSLGAVPGLIFFKNITVSADWMVYADVFGANKWLRLNDSNGYNTTTTNVFPSAATATAFNLGDDSRVNASGNSYMAYLFASTAGVSKIDTYSGSSSSVTVNCGFQPQFLMIKRYDSSSDWSVWDSVRGTNESLRWDSSDPRETFTGKVTFSSTGFTVTSGDANYNTSGGSYLYMAIADPS